MIQIRDWEKHFERDRTRQWKHLQWVPIPNKQGSGYRKIMKQKNGLEIFACWISLVEIASKASVRGDLSKYSIEELSDLTLISEVKLSSAIKFLSEVLDWVEVITNLDINVKNLDVSVKNLDPERSTAVSSSILSNSILSDPVLNSSPSDITPSTNTIESKESKNLIYRECTLLLIKSLKDLGMQPKEDDSYFASWDKDVRLMVERDKRSIDDIKKLIKDCHDHKGSGGFTWSTNICSMGTLREKWSKNKIWVGMNNKGGAENGTTQGNYGPNRNAIVRDVAPAGKYARFDHKLTPAVYPGNT